MDKKKVFMIMPFEDEFFEVYEMLKRQFEKEFIFSHVGCKYLSNASISSANLVKCVLYSLAR